MKIIIIFLFSYESNERKTIPAKTIRRPTTENRQEEKKATTGFIQTTAAKVRKL
jgi:hypothetical protein